MNTNTEIEKFEHKADVVGAMIQAVLAIFLTMVKKLLAKVRDVSANDLQVHQELAGGVPRVSLRGGAQPLVVCDFPGLAVGTARGVLDDGRAGSEGPPASPPSDAPAQGPPSEGPPAKPPSETPPRVPSEGPPASPSGAPAEVADVTRPTTWAWFELSREAWEALGERGQELLEELLGRELVTWDEVGDAVGSKPISPTSRVVMRAALARVPGLTWKEHELTPSAKAEDRLLVIDRSVVASLPDALRAPFEAEERWRTAYLVSDHDQPHLLLDGGDCDDAEDATEAFEEARAHIARVEAAGYRLDATETTHMLACTRCGEGEHARGLRPGGICGDCVRNARFSAPKKKPTRRKAEPAKATAREASSKAAKDAKKPLKPATKPAGKKPATTQTPATPPPAAKRTEPTARTRAKAPADAPSAHPDDAKQVDLEEYLKEKHPETPAAKAPADEDAEPPEVRVWIDEHAWDALTPEARADFEEPVPGSGVDWEGRVGWITARVPPEEVLTALRGYALDHHVRLIEAETEPPRTPGGDGFATDLSSMPRTTKPGRWDPLLSVPLPSNGAVFAPLAPKPTPQPERPATDAVVLSITVPERTPDAMQWAREHHLAWFEEAPAFWLPWSFEGGAPTGKIRVVATVPNARLDVVLTAAAREGLDVDATEGPDHPRASIVTFGTEVFDAGELNTTESARPWRVARVEASGVVELSRAAVEVRGVKSIDTDTREVSIDALRSFHDGTGRFWLESSRKEPPARRRRGRPAKTETAPEFEASEAGEDRVHALVTFEMAAGEWAALTRGLRAWDPTKTPSAGSIRGASNQPLELRYAPAGSPDVATLVERLRAAGAPFLDLGEVPRRAVFDKAPSNRAVREAWNAAHPDDRVSVPARAIEREPVTEETLGAEVSP